MNPPFNLKQYDTIVIYLDERGNSVYCTHTSLCPENISAYILSEKFQRIEKIGNEFIVYMYIKRRF